MKSVKALTVLLAALITVSACGPKSNSDAQAPVADQQDKTNDDTWTDPEVDSENLTDEAEQLLTLDTIEDALSKFNAALQLNPKNGRADVWASVIKSELELKGILARVRPFIESMPDGAHRYDKLVDGTNESNDATLRHFYLTGPEDIHTSDEFQEWVDRVDMRLGELRATLDRHKNEELRLLVPTSLFGGGLLGATDSNGIKKCGGRDWGPIKYQPSDCSSTSAEFLLNRADMEALSIGISGYQAYIALINAWRISPESIKEMLSHENDENFDSFGLIVKNGAKLRSSNQVSLLDTGMRDFSLSARYLIDHQKQACPKGRDAKNSRPGYVFAFGLCFSEKLVGSDSYSRTMHLLDQVLNRRAVTLPSKNGAPDIDLDINKFAAQPLSDISLLGPVKHTLCHTTEPNTTPLKAYVPRGDLDQFLLDTGYTCPLKASTP